jgi:hypothetical protein
MAYDSSLNRTVLFGGRNLGVLYGDTWAWNGSTWTMIASSGPSPRQDLAMAYDRARNRLVLFGGYDGTNRADTWELVNGSWLPQVFASGPQARRSHAMAFDATTGRVVLFGGVGAGESHLSDTWTWNGVAWTQVSSGQPLGRQGHAMAFDPVRGKVVMFGGASPLGAISQFLNDTWEWNGNTWTQVAVGGPARVEHVMAYSSQLGGVFMAGGSVSIGAGTGDCFWDGVAWTTLPISPGAGRHNAAISFDEFRGRLVISGGSVGQGASESTTIEFVGPASPGAPFGNGCGSPAPVLTPEAAFPPRIGTMARAGLSALASPVAVMMLGWSRTMYGPFTLPVSLAAINMPGCDLLQSADVFGLPVTMTGLSTADYSLPIPNVASLVDLHLYLQAVAFSPGANPAELLVSNGLDWQISY